MADMRIALRELLRKYQGDHEVDALKEGLVLLVQELMEAEWEKAARGELVGARYPWGNDIDRTKANYGGNVGSTTPVGSYAPNGYGLYDMAGNVWEWCWDWYDSGYYSSSPGSDPRGPGSGSRRVYRGGSWSSNADICRVAYRLSNSPDIGIHDLGFRLARTAP
jgi:formylglycine-generating enzyme required for sulfatase activity